MEKIQIPQVLILELNTGEKHTSSQLGWVCIHWQLSLPYSMNSFSRTEKMEEKNGKAFRTRWFLFRIMTKEHNIFTISLTNCPETLNVKGLNMWLWDRWAEWWLYFLTICQVLGWMDSHFRTLAKLWLKANSVSLSLFANGGPFSGLSLNKKIVVKLYCFLCRLTSEIDHYDRWCFQHNF